MKQNTPEWLQWRKERIGASDAPIIMGVSPFKSPYELWEEKLGLCDIGSAMSEYRREMYQALEDKSRDFYNCLFDHDVAPDVITHPTIPWMIASLDGISKCRKYAVEIKNPGIEDHEIACNNKVPKKYFPQLQHQMEVCQLESITYQSSYNDQHVFVIVKRDDKYIKKLMEKEREFYYCMMSFKAPELSDKDFKIVNNENWVNDARNYLDIKSQISFLEKKANELKENLACMYDHPNLKSGSIRFQTIKKIGNIKYSDIPELKNVDLDAYRSDPSTYVKIYQEK